MKFFSFKHKTTGSVPRYSDLLCVVYILSMLSKGTELDWPLSRRSPNENSDYRDCSFLALYVRNVGFADYAFPTGLLNLADV